MSKRLADRDDARRHDIGIFLEMRHFLRLAAPFGFFVLLMIFWPATPAIADCGQHALTTIFKPIALEVEANRASSETVLQLNGPGAVSLQKLTGMVNFPYSFAPCPEDGLVDGRAPFMLEMLWQGALLLDFERERLPRTLALDDKACAPFELADFSDVAGQMYSDIMTGQNPSAMKAAVHAMKRLPDWRHVRDLWAKLTVALGFNGLPAVGDEEIWSESMHEVAESLQAHLPDGLSCLAVRRIEPAKRY